MTDGPFRNAKLKKCWEDYGEDLVNDAMSPKERAARAGENMLKDVDNLKEISAVLSDLQAQAQNSQLDLDIISLVRNQFENQSLPPFMNSLQKELIASLHNSMPLDAALDRALQSVVRGEINDQMNRMHEECIAARSIGDMSEQEYQKGTDRNRQAFSQINPDALCEVLKSGQKSIFKQALKKKSGVDDGPDESGDQ